MKAIIIPYAVEQNEPSVPHKKIVDIPEERSKHREILLPILKEHYSVEDGAGDDSDYDNFVIVYGGVYGDIHFGDGDFFLFVTFIEE